MDRDIIFQCIPDAAREKYGKTRDEQIDNFIKANPDIFDELDYSEPSEPLDYMVMVLTRELGQANLAYKGGYILNKRIPNCRYTKDVDLSIAKKELYEEVKSIMQKIAEEFISKGLISRYTIKPDVSETSSGGIQFYDLEGVKSLGVDVGLHPLSYGITKLSLSFGDINVFTVERSLADKLSVICSRKRFRRVKDLYDIYMFTNMFDINYSLLCECLNHRTVTWDLFPKSEEVLVQLSYAYDKLTIGKADDTFVKSKPEFPLVMSKLLAFCHPFLFENEDSPNEWNHERSMWL